MSPKRVVYKARSTWVRLNEWLGHNPLPAYVLVVIVTAWAIGTAYEAGQEGKEAGDRANDAIHANEKERTARSKAAAEIQRFACKENNKQDRILATVLAIALKGADDGRGLTKREAHALAVFSGLLAELRVETPCQPLIEAFLEASNTADYKAIRELLIAQEKREQERAQRASKKALGAVNVR